MAKPTQNVAVEIDEDGPLDLHLEYRTQRSCGFLVDLTLRCTEVQSIAIRMRGITSIAAVLQAADVVDVCTLSDFMRGGLIDAVDALAEDVQNLLHKANDRAKKTAQAPQQKGA